MHSPSGTWLLFFPCAWSTCLAADPLPSLPSLSLFLFGSFVMRGAGCTINDMWDRDIDRKIERTVSRPLASGRLSRKEALGWLAAQLSVGLGVLLSLNWTCVFIGASSMGLVVLYPLAKRVTNYPQLMLGLTFNWGALLGYTQAFGCFVPEVCLPLYLAGVSWTLYYDTVYAHQDKVGDRLLGLGSTALTFGDNKTFLRLTASGAVAGVAAAGLGAGLGEPFYLTLLAGWFMLHRQIQRVDLMNPEDCFRVFAEQQRFGLLVLSAILLGAGWKHSKQLT